MLQSLIDNVHTFIPYTYRVLCAVDGGIEIFPPQLHIANGVEKIHICEAVQGREPDSSVAIGVREPEST